METTCNSCRNEWSPAENYLGSVSIMFGKVHPEVCPFNLGLRRMNDTPPACPCLPLPDAACLWGACEHPSPDGDRDTSSHLHASGEPARTLHQAGTAILGTLLPGKSKHSRSRTRSNEKDLSNGAHTGRQAGEQASKQAGMRTIQKRGMLGSVTLMGSRDPDGNFSRQGILSFTIERQSISRTAAHSAYMPISN